jgi:hypothetical protein
MMSLTVSSASKLKASSASAVSTPDHAAEEIAVLRFSELSKLSETPKPEIVISAITNNHTRIINTPPKCHFSTFK